MLNKIYFSGLLLLGPSIALAADIQPHDPISNVILWVTIFFSFAILGRYVAKLLNQPGVLGELLMGVVIGNICYFFGSQLIVILREGAAIYNIMKDLLANIPLEQAVTQNIPNAYYASQVTHALSSSLGIEYIKVGYVLDVFSRYGVIFLLFKVGLESSIQELRHTGLASIRVAVIGVVLPIILGFIVAYLIVPEASYKVNLFVAATLSATSIGITASVLSEMKKLKTREAQTILGAAMFDDILGLIILAIVSSIVLQGQVNFLMIGQVIILTILFFMLAILIGPWLLNKSIKYFQFLDLWEEKLFISFIFVMFLAWLATVIKLASIIGAFAAGLIINDNFFEGKRQHSFKIHDLISPIESLLAPLFFMLIGLQVKIEAFMHWQVIGMAFGLIVAAIVGKLLSGLGGNKKDDRLLIGIGMLPRGEVGLVFASIGRTLGVISDQLFSAIILMVIVTTIVAPPWLKSRYAKQKGVV
ncbi:cation:proton antiporter [Legionella sp. D16C41]|uniref:cation:proton antiporter n=1 Tax=Legionella sp. D16C41 TaxID=3402688 RepID=UPI003AF84314